ncbi:hypothetical protein NQ318_020639 [Aromia moschata]|uniref:Uncharacterized protein n=1 Tax=Aromia moschata TaxID=1265417 RepID=A0AAV8XE07_9CUCU|nr:hypothetical protein NQ318_020639 [Aromia moschata]
MHKLRRNLRQMARRSRVQTYPGKTGKSENNYIAKCKLCGRENSLDIIPGSNGKYTNDDQAKAGLLKPREARKVFDGVNLTEKEWVE